MSKYELSYDNSPNPFYESPSHFPSESYRYFSPNNVTRITAYSANGTKDLDKQFEYKYDNEGKPIKESATTLISSSLPVNKTTVSSIDYY
jgi:hypothetical protein